MKKVLSVLGRGIVVGALASGVVFANPVGKENPKAKFEHVKARILHMIDKRIDFLQKHKACVEKAQNWKELRACRPKRRPWHHPMKKMEHRPMNPPAKNPSPAK